MDDSSNIEKFWIKNIDEKRTGFNEIVVENKIKNFEILKIFSIEDFVSIGIPMPIAKKLFLAMKTMPLTKDEYSKIEKNVDKDPLCALAVGLCYLNGSTVDKNEGKAVEYLEKAGENKFAQFYLAEMYENGKNKPKDLKKAFELYQKASDQGNLTAQIIVGNFYENGIVVTKDIVRAFKEYKTAADHHHPTGMLNVATCLKVGNGCTKDEKESLVYFHKAADEGLNATAQFRLAVMYEEGIMTAIDEKKALHYYEISAKQGEVKSQYNLGIYYAKNRNVPEAMKWWALAAQANDVDAQFNLATYYQKLKKPTESANYFKLAAENNHAWAQYQYALLLLNGKIFEKK